MDPAVVALVGWDQELVLLLPLPLLFTTGLTVGGARPRLRVFNQVLLLLVPAFLAMIGLADAAAGIGHSAVVMAGLGLLLTGAAGLVVQAPPVAAVLRRVVPYDPANQVHLLSVVLSILLVGSQVTTQLTTDVLETAAGGPALTQADLVLQEVPFLLAAAIGVGWLTRRGPRAVLDRLGYRVPAWWQIVLACATAGAFYAFGTGMDWLAQHFTPDLAHRVGAATDRIFGGLANPLGIATIAIVPGLCEEALFRGAMQPRLGLAWTAVVFTAVHTQYGLSLDAAAVFILALGLGLLRRYTNTTTSTVCHIVYNGLVGFGIGWAGAGPALAAEGLFLAVLATALLLFLVRRRRDADLLTGRVGAGEHVQ
jgi:uncharacterized protein